MCLATKNLQYWGNYELVSNRRKNLKDGKEKNVNILTLGNYHMATVNYTVWVIKKVTSYTSKYGTLKETNLKILTLNSQFSGHNPCNFHTQFKTS